MNVTSRLCTSTALVCGLALAMYSAAVAQKPAQTPRSHRAGNPSAMAPTAKAHDSFKGIAAKLGMSPADLESAYLAAKRSEEHTSELQSLRHLVCRLLLEKKKTAQ